MHHVLNIGELSVACQEKFLTIRNKLQPERLICSNLCFYKDLVSQALFPRVARTKFSLRRANSLLVRTFFRPNCLRGVVNAHLRNMKLDSCQLCRNS